MNQNLISAATKSGRPASAHSARQKNGRVLVIDDTRAIHEDFRKILAEDESAGALAEAEAALFGEAAAASQRDVFTVDSAYQGNEGFAMVQSALAEGRPYAVAFIDIRMPPGWDGIETTQRIWEIDPDLQVVICTAYSDYSWEEMIERIGNSDRLVILKKPFDTVEVLQLANALTEKWSLLQETRRKMDDLEKLVSERTRHLQETNEKLQVEIDRRQRREQHLALQSNVTGVLAGANATTADVLNRVLEIICRELGWDTGALWLLDPQAKLLLWSAMWHPPDTTFNSLKTAGEPARFQIGCGLPGRVWETKEPQWSSATPSLTDDPRNDAAQQTGMRSAVAFPLHLRGEILGVAEFHSTRVRPIEADLNPVFATLGSLIGQALERKKLEDQLRHSQKMDAIGCLAGGVAHDFNNILTIIQGYAQAAEMKEGLDKETSDALRQITQAAQRASSLTRQLLTFSRKQMMQFKEINLSQAIENLAKMLQRIIGEDVALRITASAPAFVQADEDMISQILMNLAINARDAMPKGGELEICTDPVTIDDVGAQRHAEARPGNFVCLRVKDTGCGIAAEHLSRIFEPFFTTKGVGRGTGLGLSTVYGIVKQHKGWIEVESEPGAGTMFRILMPRVGAASQTPAGKTATGDKRGNETVLLVEDEDSVRNLARMILSMNGYKVLEAGSGADAVAVWKKHAPEIDLLLTDIIMPGGMNGRELAQKLRTDRSNLNIVFTSGYDPNKADLKEDMIFLPKPYSPQKLLQAVRQGLATESVSVAC